MPAITHDENGVVAVETAILLPVVTAILFGCVDLNLAIPQLQVRPTANLKPARVIRHHSGQRLRTIAAATPGRSLMALDILEIRGGS